MYNSEKVNRKLRFPRKYLLCFKGADLLSIEGIGESLAENILRSKNLDKANSVLDKCEKKIK